MLVCGIERFCLHNMQRAVCGRRCWTLLYSEKSYGSWFSYEPSKNSAFYFHKSILFLLLAVKTFDKRPGWTLILAEG